MFNKKILLILCFISTSLFLFSIEKFIDAEMLKSSSKPKITPEGILITCDKSFGKRLYLRTNLDGWKNNHYFNKSYYDVFYLYLQYDLSRKNVQYLINTDGFWETDPNNTEFTLDKYGTKLSVINVPNDVIYEKQNPIIEKNELSVKRATFFYKDDIANEVNFVCSIDNWSQFTNSMVLNKDGYWEITMPFKKGRYYYYFQVNGKKVIDIENNNKINSGSEGIVSYFDVE